MTISLLWPGPPALSQFRLDKLRAELNDFCGAQRVQGVYAQTLHALAVSRALSDAERDVARALLTYGPQREWPTIQGTVLFTVAPRLGTISPWSSKATDIFATAGLPVVTRVERCTRWVLHFGQDQAPDAALLAQLAARLFDRMTERLVDEVELAINLYKSDEMRLTVSMETTDFETVLTKADFLTFHVPGIGRALLGEAELARMKKGSYVVNTARGGIIEEQALLAALNSGHIAGAGLDVFDNEPTPMAELLHHPNVSVTPHIGASTLEAQANIGLELADKILAFFGDDK